jgi:hypothetical protein
MERMFGKSTWVWCMAFLVMLTVVSVMRPGPAPACKASEANDVIIIGKNFVDLNIFNEGVILKSTKGTFAPTEFLGVEGTAVMLFLYNRITRDMGVDIVQRTYKGRIDRPYAEKAVDLALKFYSDNELIFKSRFEEKPATKIGIQRFRI